MNAPAGQPDTRGDGYSARLVSLSGSKWKRVLNVQYPYQWNLRRLNLGKCLDVGCGIGRNLAYLPAGSVGVDHNETSIGIARQRGMTAYSTDEFKNSGAATPASYDSALFAHLLEHLDVESRAEVVASYLPLVRPGGRVVFITPQERGYASDATHVAFTDFASLTDLAHKVGLSVEEQYSFPFPRAAGKLFTYNEFVLVCGTD